MVSILQAYLFAEVKILFHLIPLDILAYLVENPINNGLPTMCVSGTNPQYLGNGTQELHHIIPWELIHNSNGNMNSTIAAIKEIWHPNDLLENGFPIWKKVKGKTNDFVTGTFETIDDEIVFHGNHPAYTEYVSDQLGKILKENKSNPLAMKKAVQDLTAKLKANIVEAYESGKSLNQAALGWKPLD